MKPAGPSSAGKKDTPAPAPSGGTRRVRKPGTRRGEQPWIEPMGIDCPTSHPVKAKLSSMLYHLPGMAAYKRTRPDRCYRDPESAEADGFTRAKR